MKLNQEKVLISSAIYFRFSKSFANIEKKTNKQILKIFFKKRLVFIHRRAPFINCVSIPLNVVQYV